MAYAPKVRVNAGGMTEGQVKAILRLANEKAWDLHPNQTMREFYAIHIGDVESNPATSVLTGGWGGTASKLIDSLTKLPNAADVQQVDAIQELLKPDPWKQAAQMDPDGIPDVVNHDTGETADEIDPWEDDTTTAKESPIDPAALQIIRANQPDKPIVGEGVYRFNGELFAVVESNKNPGRHYAYRVILLDDKTYRHVYAAGAIFSLTEAMRVPAGEVVELNKATQRLDGKTGKLIASCCVCGRTLRKKSSVEAGIGPVCGGRVGF